MEIKELIFGVVLGVAGLYYIYLLVVDKKNQEDNQETINHHLNSYNAILELTGKVSEAVEEKHQLEDRLINKLDIEKETLLLKELTEKVQALTDRVETLTIEEQRLTSVLSSKKADIKNYDNKIKEKIADFKELEQSQLTTEEREVANTPQKKTAPKRPDFLK